MTELDTFDPHAPCVEPPYEAMAEARGRCPVASTPSGWFVSSYDDVKTVLSSIDSFGGSYGDVSSFPPDELTLPNLVEPRHGKVRRVVNAAIARHRTAELEPYIRELGARFTEETVVRAEADGSVDLMTSFAGQIPSRVVARALGVPVEDAEQFQRWADELVEEFWANDPAPLSELHPGFAAYIDDLIAQRRRSGGGEDFISRLMVADVDGETLSDVAVRANALNLIIGGNETTRSLVGNCLYRLAQDPALLARVRADRALIAGVVEESLRFDTPIQMLERNAREDVTIGTESVPCGDHLVIGLSSANRDERTFEDPDVFRIDRARPKDHLAFGAGPHVCPGAFLARLEAVTVLDTFLDRVVTYSLVEPDEFDGNPIYCFRAPLSLPVVIEQTTVPSAQEQPDDL